MEEEPTRATVILENPGLSTKVWVTEDGRVVGQMFGEDKTGPEISFETRQDLLIRWDEVTAHKVIRDLKLAVDEDDALIDLT